MTTEPPNRYERQKARTRARILAAGTELFNRDGYDVVTMEQIAATAGVALRTVYYHFDNKAAVALARFHQWMDDLGAALADQPGGRSPPEILAGALAAVSQQGYAGEQPLLTPEGRSILPAPGALLLAESDPEVAGQVYQRLIEAFSRLVRLFEDRLDYPEGSMEPKVVASSFVSLWFVAVHGWSGSDVEGTGPPMAVNDLLVGAFGLYSDGLAKVWAPAVARKRQGRPGKPAE
jgi:AcrR family transcriptional regulator